MQQYFIDKIVQVNDCVYLHEEQAHHIVNVMRMKTNEQVRIVDRKQHLFLAHIKFEHKKVVACIDRQLEDYTKPKVEIVLAQGLLKKEKWDFLLQKSAELGVSEIRPFISSRSVVKSKDERQDKKMIRWNKILLEACEQCKRTSLVTLHMPCYINDIVDVEGDLKLVAYEDADIISHRMIDVLKQYTNVKRVVVAIGCEGGFSLEEVTFLEQHGFIRVSLGSRILRAETAAMNTIGNLSFYYESIQEEIR